DRSHLSAAFSPAEEPIAAIGLEPRDVDSRGHLDAFQHFSGPRIDPPQLALVAFPGSVPELAVDPRHPGDEAVRLDRAQDRARLGIDLQDLAVLVLTDPERPFGPSEPRVAPSAGRRDRAEHASGLRV